MSLVERMFDPVFFAWMRTRLRIHVAGPTGTLPRDVPWVYCVNHESWWDGFLIRLLHRRLRPRAPFRAVMLERELRRRPFLRWLGALGLEVGSRASGRRLLRGLSETPRSAGIAFFPQGRIVPDAVPPLRFRRGVRAVVRAVAPAAVVPVAIRILPGRSARMDAFLSVGEPLLARRSMIPSVADMETAVLEELDAIRAFVRQFEENAADLWPEAAGLLPRGRSRAWPLALSPLPFSRN